LTVGRVPLFGAHDRKRRGNGVWTSWPRRQFCFAKGGGAGRGFSFFPPAGQTESGLVSCVPPKAKDRRWSFVAGFTPIKRGGSVAPSGPPRQFSVKVNDWCNLSGLKMMGFVDTSNSLEF
jgi:hypothetical protein